MSKELVDRFILAARRDPALKDFLEDLLYEVVRYRIEQWPDSAEWRGWKSSFPKFQRFMGDVSGFEEFPSNIKWTSAKDEWAVLNEELNETNDLQLIDYFEQKFLELANDVTEKFVDSVYDTVRDENEDAREWDKGLDYYHGVSGQFRNLRAGLIRIAKAHPETRKHLLPLIRS